MVGTPSQSPMLCGAKVAVEWTMNGGDPLGPMKGLSTYRTGGNEVLGVLGHRGPPEPLAVQMESASQTWVQPHHREPPPIAEPPTLVPLPL